MGITIFLVLLVCTIPGIYFAYKKNFFIILSKKYNRFPILLLFTIPWFGGLSALLSLFIFLALDFLLPSLVDSMVNTFGSNIGLLLPMMANIVVIAFFNKFIIEKEDTELGETKESELFVYFPIYLYRTHWWKDYGTKFSYPEKAKGELRLGIQESNLFIDKKQLKGIRFAFTENGKIIADKRAMQIINENELTGFKTQPIQNFKSKDFNESYFQILPTYTMPKMASETKIIYVSWGLGAYKRIRDKKVYYNKDVLSEALDFNQSFEVIGYENGGPYPPQRHWIVSKKARSVLINKLGQNDFDFIPVRFIEDGATSK